MQSLYNITRLLIDILLTENLQDVLVVILQFTLVFLLIDLKIIYDLKLLFNDIFAKQFQSIYIILVEFCALVAKVIRTWSTVKLITIIAIHLFYLA